VKVLARNHNACTTFTTIFMASVLSVSETLCYFFVLCRCYVAILLTF